MRRIAVAAAIVFAGACGSSTPTSPNAGRSPSPRAVSIPAGPYTLTITPSSAGTSGPSFCIGTGTLVMTPVRLAVNAERTGDIATLRSVAPNTNLVVEFRISGPTVLGTISGSATDEGGHQISATGEVTGAAPPDLAITVSGNINGGVSTGSGSCSNNGHLWSLAR